MSKSRLLFVKSCPLFVGRDHVIILTPITQYSCRSLRVSRIYVYVLRNIVWLFVLLVAVAACAPQPLIVAVEFSPATITPNGDGKADLTHISYTLGRNATVSIYFTDAQGQNFYFRRDLPRTLGTHQVLFGGIIDNTMMPNGAYTWVLEASDGKETSQQKGQLVIADADTALLELRNLTASPPVFTPNRDGLSDRATINVYVSKDATLRVYLLGADRIEYPMTEKAGGRKLGEMGLHTFDYDAGVDQGAEPPPDGAYTVVAEATDLVGQFAQLTTTLTITQAGVPRAEIVDGEVEFSKGTFVLGQTLYFTLTVENYGTVPIRTSGPQPGVCYDMDQNYNTARPEKIAGYAVESGVWRVGIDFDTSLRNYPFRWAVGSPADLDVVKIDNQEFYYLAPGKRAVITGCIRLTQVPPRNPFYFWAGLIHEDVEITSLNNNVDPHLVTIDRP